MHISYSPLSDITVCTLHTKEEQGSTDILQLRVAASTGTEQTTLLLWSYKQHQATVPQQTYPYHSARRLVHLYRALRPESNLQTSKH